MKDIKDYVEKYAALLPLNRSISYTEAEHRAGEFLSALATLANWKHLLMDDKIRLLSTQTVVYAEELSKATAKTITENKINVEASAVYIAAREGLERIENDIAYIKAYQELFLNGHLYYRAMAKGQD